jgi:hypothetical protein
MNRRDLLKLGASVAAVPARSVAQHENEAVFALTDWIIPATVLESLDARADSDLAPGHRFFQMLKVMTAEIYYATEIGFQELNKSGVPATFGCQHPGHA